MSDKGWPKPTQIGHQYLECQIGEKYAKFKVAKLGTYQ